MSDIEKTNALKTLGLVPGASKAQIEQAYKALLAFSSPDANQDGSISALAQKMRAEIESAYKVLSIDAAPTKATTGGGGTAFSTTDKQTAKAPGGKNNGLAWLVGILLVGGFLYQVNHKEPSNPELPTSTPATQLPGNDRPPDFVMPFIHNDDVKGQAVRWTSGWENVNAAQVMVVWGYAANNDPVYKFEMYQDNGTWREQRQYIVRYSSDRLQVDVQRFQEQGSVPVFKDQRNISSAGDVLVQTTIYKYLPDAKLAAVQVDTPFMTAKDGLRFTRNGGGVDVDRVPAGGQVYLNRSAQWLNNLFDMWNTFGAPNV